MGAGLSWFFYYVRKKDLLGGFIGGLIVGIMGAILGSLGGKVLKWAIDFLQNGMLFSHVNVISGLLGGYIALYIFNRINHDKNRRDF